MAHIMETDASNESRGWAYHALKVLSDVHEAVLAVEDWRCLTMNRATCSKSGDGQLIAGRLLRVGAWIDPGSRQQGEMVDTVAEFC